MDQNCCTWYIHALDTQTIHKNTFQIQKESFDPCQSMQSHPWKLQLKFSKQKKKEGKQKEQLHNFRMRIEKSAYFHDFDWAVVVGWPLCLVIWCEKCCFCFFLFADVPKTRNILHQGARLLQLSCTKPKAAFGGKAFSLFPLLSAVCWCFKGVLSTSIQKYVLTVLTTQIQIPK